MPRLAFPPEKPYALLLPTTTPPPPNPPALGIYLFLQTSASSISSISPRNLPVSSAFRIRLRLRLHILANGIDAILRPLPLGRTSTWTGEDECKPSAITETSHPRNTSRPFLRYIRSGRGRISKRSSLPIFNLSEDFLSFGQNLSPLYSGSVFFAAVLSHLVTLGFFRLDVPGNLLPVLMTCRPYATDEIHT